MDREFGDFQTPLLLVDAVLKCLSSGKEWSRVIEPTCGRGNFIEGLIKLAQPPDEIQGIEIQETHANCASRVAKQSMRTKIGIQRANLFDLHLQRDIQWSSNGPLLVVGNPPWVTNAELGSIESNNLPTKTNMKGLQGLEARLGKSNFDIAEYIWLKLLRELASEQPTIALLCKTSVARNVLQFAFEAGLPIRNAFIRKVGISGLHKTPRFRAIGPVDGLPVMLDDTCYFIACNSAEQAAFLTALLNDPLCLDFIQVIAFLDAKRPITKKLLQRIDLRALYNKVNRQAHILRVKHELEHLGVKMDLQEIETFSIESLYEEYAPRLEQARYTMDALFPDNLDILPSTAF